MESWMVAGDWYVVRCGVVFMMKKHKICNPKSIRHCCRYSDIVVEIDSVPRRKKTRILLVFY